MKKEYFFDYIKNWTSEIDWDNSEIVSIAGLLLEISKLNGGETIYDVELPDEDKKYYAVKKADDVLQKKINAFASSFREDKTFRYYGKAKGKSTNDKLKFMIPHELIPRVELNSCTLKELDELPGIGKVTGQRIIDRRESIGPFKDLKEVLEVKGITKHVFYKFKNKVYVKSEDIEHPFLFPALITFLNNPDFSGYIELQVSTNGALGNKMNLDMKTRIIQELEETRNTLTQNTFFTHKHLKQTRNSDVISQKELVNKANAIEQKGITEIIHSGLVFDSQYPKVIKELIRNCNQSLYIIMFFFRFEDEPDYPTDELVSEIIKAKKRGANIKVILDQDEETDPYKSKEINKGIYEYLKKKDIKVVFDVPEKLTHTKLFIVDERHVVIGSHNLTAGSFYVYDDTSIYIESKDFASDAINYFNGLWDEYA